MEGNEYILCSEAFAYIILVALGLFIGIGILYAIISEKRGFNNGICPICGKNLNILIMTHRVVEDIAVHLQNIVTTLGFHTDLLIKILASS